MDYEYEDGFQCGLETENAAELKALLTHPRPRSLGTPPSWFAGLGAGFAAKQSAVPVTITNFLPVTR
jgi:hypothetical protein